MSNLSVCENIEEKSVIAKPDQEKDGRTKARKKKELKNVEHILKSVHSLESEAKLQVSSSWLPSIGFVFLRFGLVCRQSAGSMQNWLKTRKKLSLLLKPTKDISRWFSEKKSSFKQRTVKASWLDQG